MFAVALQLSYTNHIHVITIHVVVCVAFTELYNEKKIFCKQCNTKAGITQISSVIIVVSDN